MATDRHGRRHADKGIPTGGQYLTELLAEMPDVDLFADMGQPSPNTAFQFTPATAYSPLASEDGPNAKDWDPLTSTVRDGDFTHASEYPKGVLAQVPAGRNHSGTFDVVRAEGRCDGFVPREVTKEDEQRVKEMLEMFDLINRSTFDDETKHTMKRALLEGLDKPYLRTFSGPAGMGSKTVVSNALWSPKALAELENNPNPNLHDEHVVPIKEQIAEIEFRARFDPEHSARKTAYLIASFPRAVVTGVGDEASRIDQMGGKDTMPKAYWGSDSLSMWCRYDLARSTGKYNWVQSKNQDDPVFHSMQPDEEGEGPLFIRRVDPRSKKAGWYVEDDQNNRRSKEQVEAKVKAAEGTVSDRLSYEISRTGQKDIVLEPTTYATPDYALCGATKARRGVVVSRCMSRQGHAGNHRWTMVA